MSKTKKSHIWEKVITLLLLLLRIVSVLPTSGSDCLICPLILVEFFTGIVVGFKLGSVQYLELALLICKLQFNFFLSVHGARKQFDVQRGIAAVNNNMTKV